MPESLDERLHHAQLRMRTGQTLKSKLREAESVVRRQRKKRSELKEVLAREEADVQKLEGLSLAGLFQSVLGTKQDRLDKERQEFLSAKLQYDTAGDELLEMESLADQLRKEWLSHENAKEEYAELLAEKESLLQSLGGVPSQQLIQSSELLAELEGREKELREAIRAGQAASQSLRQVESALDSAAGWGTWDMLGGGVLTTMAKHSKMSDAQNAAKKAQRHLRRFESELADANRRLRISLDVGGLATFADYFFDGLLTDWIVQSKINNAKSACESTVRKVTEAVDACKKELKSTEKERAECVRLRNDLIKQSKLD